MFTKQFIKLYIMLISFFPLFLFGGTRQDIVSSEKRELILKAVFDSTTPNYNGPKIVHERVDPFPTIGELKGTPFYKCTLSNFPLVKNQKFTFYSVNAVKNIAKIADVYVSKDQKAFIKMPGKKAADVPFEKNILTMCDPLPGETFDYILLSTDGKIRAATHIVPRPIESHGPSGQTIKLELKSNDGSLFYLIGENFKPLESLNFTSYSEGEKITHQFEADKNGNFLMSIDPRVIGKKNGKAGICIESSDSSPLILRFVWGENNLEKTKHCELSDFYKTSQS
jgi:hypothetical protein